MNLIILFFIIEIFSGIITFNFYKAAGRQAWEAFIPIYRVVILLRIIERPWWWVILWYMPVVGNVMAIVVIFELLHVFNYRKLFHTILAIITLGLYLGYLNFTEKLVYKGRDIQDMRRHVSELVASLIFAIVAATVIRAYTFEAFTIPTPSMEKSLLVGDFLFVSKLEYGSRPPMTPLALPLVHNKIPFTTMFTKWGINSYVDWIQLPYWRFPKISDVQRDDPVVFNYPSEDVRPIQMEGQVRPIDKREHYVKRCMAIPGDSLRVVDGQVYVNGKPNVFPDRAEPESSYYVETNGLDFNPKMLKERFDINYVKDGQLGDGAVLHLAPDVYVINIAYSQVDEFKKLPNIKAFVPMVSKINPADYGKIPSKLKQLYLQVPQFGVDKDLFPNPKDSSKIVYKWTRDNYGPVYLPKAGDKIELNLDNYYRYRRCITAYEHNALVYHNGQFILNGKPATSYTFKQGYYFMMGDNRHASDDSRYWGYVPEDHIVGKPVFIWMSYDKYAEGIHKIRFNRVFTTVNGSGKRFSYFWPFIIVVVLFTIGNRYYKKKKREKEIKA